MPTTVTFEVATIADAIAKAARVAPAKAGNAFDKAAGILLKLDPDAETKCTVFATNLDIFSIEAVDCTSLTGDAVSWRLPSNLLAEVLKGIKPTVNPVVELSTSPTHNRVDIKSGRLKASLALLDAGYYPEFHPVELDETQTVIDLGSTLDLVSWCTAKAGSEPLNGVHFTGDHVVATDQFRVARAPLSVRLATPITVPATVLGSIIRQRGDVEVGTTGNQFIINPDEYSQIGSVIFGLPYPIAAIDRITKITYEHKVKVAKQLLIDQVALSTAFAGSDRAPVMQLIIGKKEIATFMRHVETGLIGNVIELSDGADHPRISIYLTPQYLIEALNHAPNANVTLCYNTQGDIERTPLCIDGGSGYQAWIAPRKKPD